MSALPNLPVSEMWIKGRRTGTKWRMGMYWARRHVCETFTFWTRSLGALWATASSWRPFRLAMGPLCLCWLCDASTCARFPEFLWIIFMQAGGYLKYTCKHLFLIMCLLDFSESYLHADSMDFCIECSERLGNIWQTHLYILKTVSATRKRPQQLSYHSIRSIIFKVVLKYLIKVFV